MNFEIIYSNQIIDVPRQNKNLENECKIYFIKNNWDDYGYHTTFSIYLNVRNEYIGDAKLCAKPPQDFVYSMQQYIVDEGEKIKVWMIGANFAFYQRLKEIIKNKFSNLQIYYDFLDQMNDLVLFPERLKELQQDASGDLQAIIENSILRNEIYTYRNLYDIHNCGKIIFNKKFRNNYRSANEDPFLIKNFRYVYRYINSENIDEVKITSLFENLANNINRSTICMNFLSSFCAYILLESFLPNEDELFNRLIFDNVDALLQDILKKYRECQIATESIQSKKIQLHNPKLYLILESLSENVDTDSALFKMILIILGSKEERKIAQSVNKIMRILKVDSKYFDSKNDNLIGQYTTIDHLYDLIKPNENNVDGKRESPSLRLSNLQQMNDPMEGKVLEECFPMIIEKKHYKDNMKESNSYYDKKINTANSGIFISSATSSLDNLPMWKQYAENATGISLTYKNSYLSKILNKTDVKLYRVCYIDPAVIVKNFKMKKKLTSLDNTDENIYNLYISKIKSDEKLESKIYDINVNLSTIFQNLRTIDDNAKNDEQNKRNFRRAIKCIRSLRYLFKNQYYSYENEFRFVRDLGTDTDEITCDKRISSDHPVPFLRTYIYENGERVRVEYSKVILGAKSLDSDYIAPYIKYCDKSLDIYNSNISYR